MDGVASAASWGNVDKDILSIFQIEREEQHISFDAHIDGSTCFRFLPSGEQGTQVVISIDASRAALSLCSIVAIGAYVRALLLLLRTPLSTLEGWSARNTVPRTRVFVSVVAHTTLPLPLLVICRSVDLHRGIDEVDRIVQLVERELDNLHESYAQTASTDKQAVVDLAALMANFLFYAGILETFDMISHVVFTPGVVSDSQYRVFEDVFSTARKRDVVTSVVYMSPHVEYTDSASCGLGCVTTRAFLEQLAAECGGEILGANQLLRSPSKRLVFLHSLLTRHVQLISPAINTRGVGGGGFETRQVNLSAFSSNAGVHVATGDKRCLKLFDDADALRDRPPQALATGTSLKFITKPDAKLEEAGRRVPDGSVRVLFHHYMRLLESPFDVLRVLTCQGFRIVGGVGWNDGGNNGENVWRRQHIELRYDLHPGFFLLIVLSGRFRTFYDFLNARNRVEMQPYFCAPASGAMEFLLPSAGESMVTYVVTYVTHSSLRKRAIKYRLSGNRGDVDTDGVLALNKGKRLEVLLLPSGSYMFPFPKSGTAAALNMQRYCFMSYAESRRRLVRTLTWWSYGTQNVAESTLEEQVQRATSTGEHTFRYVTEGACAVTAVINFEQMGLVSVTVSGEGRVLASSITRLYEYLMMEPSLVCLEDVNERGHVVPTRRVVALVCSSRRDPLVEKSHLISTAVAAAREGVSQSIFDGSPHVDDDQVLPASLDCVWHGRDTHPRSHVVADGGSSIRSEYEGIKTRPQVSSGRDKATDQSVVESFSRLSLLRVNRDEQGTALEPVPQSLRTFQENFLTTFRTIYRFKEAWCASVVMQSITAARIEQGFYCVGLGRTCASCYLLDYHRLVHFSPCQCMTLVLTMRMVVSMKAMMEVEGRKMGAGSYLWVTMKMVVVVGITRDQVTQDVTIVRVVQRGVDLRERQVGQGILPQHVCAMHDALV